MKIKLGKYTIEILFKQILKNTIRIKLVNSLEYLLIMAEKRPTFLNIQSLYFATKFYIKIEDWFKLIK